VTVTLGQKRSDRTASVHFDLCVAVISAELRTAAASYVAWLPNQGPRVVFSNARVSLTVRDKCDELAVPWLPSGLVT
jgi:hypothetical protein